MSHNTTMTTTILSLNDETVNAVTLYKFPNIGLQIVYVKDIDKYQICNENNNTYTAYYLNDKTLYYSKKQKLICPFNEILTIHSMCK